MDMKELSTIIASAINPEGSQIPINIANEALSVAAEYTRGVSVSLYPDMEVSQNQHDLGLY